MSMKTTSFELKVNQNGNDNAITNPGGTPHSMRFAQTDKRWRNRYYILPNAVGSRGVLWNHS